MFKIHSRTFKDTWQVATTFIGTIVGAGFASGQEIMKFFSHQGLGGLLGILLCTLLFSVTGTLVMLIGQKIHAQSFGDLIRHLCGKYIGPVLDVLLSIFLFGSLSVMLAGAGAVFNQQWHFPFWLGVLVTLIVTIITVLFGLRGIINANSLVVPLMITLCLLVTVPSISPKGLTAALTSFRPAGQAVSPHWALSALLYVSYNLTMGVSVLAPLGGTVKGRKALILGGLSGGIGLGLLALLLDLAILSRYPASAAFEIPSLYIASSLAKVIQIGFSFILWAEIYTTIIGNVYGLSVRITDAIPVSYKKSTVLLLFFSVFLSSAGFSHLVGIVYPLFGYISIIFLLALFLYPLRN